MDQQQAVDLTREAILLALYVGAPVLLVGMAVGLLIGLMQAVTQIQDQTVAFVPKIVAMVIALAFALPWLLQIMSDYSIDLIHDIPNVISGSDP